MGRSDDYRRCAKECLDMAIVVQYAKSRASLFQLAQVWLRLPQAHDAKEAFRSRLRIRVFQIGLLRKLLPSLGHFFQDPLLLLGFCLSRQAAAFLREALVLG